MRFFKNGNTDKGNHFYTYDELFLLDDQFDKSFYLNHIKCLINERSDIEDIQFYKNFIESEDIKKLPFNLIRLKRKAISYLMNDPEYKEKLLDLFREFIKD